MATQFKKNDKKRQTTVYKHELEVRFNIHNALICS